MWIADVGTSHVVVMPSSPIISSRTERYTYVPYLHHRLTRCVRATHPVKNKKKSSHEEKLSGDSLVLQAGSHIIRVLYHLHL